FFTRAENKLIARIALATRRAIMELWTTLHIPSHTIIAHKMGGLIAQIHETAKHFHKTWDPWLNGDTTLSW
ncbi:Hypothetical predicted protein, partial [Pelobates cultripes]